MADSGMNRVVQHLLQVARGRDGGDLTDGQLLECFLVGRDEVAFEALVHRHGPMVLGVCRRLLGHVQDAEDAFQATFLVLVRKASGLWPRAKVGNWLYGVAYRIALKARALRHRRLKREKPMRSAAEPQTGSREPGADWLAALDREIQSLPAKYRTAIILCDLEGKTQIDAANLLGWPQGTLSGRLSRAHALLARRLARRGYTVTATALTTALAAQSASAKVPLALMAATIKAVGFSALKQAVTAGAISAQVTVLTEGVIKAMLWTKLKTGIVGVLALAVIATGLGRAIYTASGQSKGPEVGGQQEAPKAVKTEGTSPKTKKLETLLGRNVSDFNYKDLPLGNVLEDLRRDLGINIFVDKDLYPLNDAGNRPSPDEIQVSVQLKNVPLETALRYLVRSANLAYVKKDGVVVVTSRDKSMIRKVYPVGNLVGEDQEKNSMALIRAITTTVEPGNWSHVNFGTGVPMNSNVSHPFQGGAGMFGMVGNQFGMMGAGPPPAPQPPVSEGGPAEGGGSIAYFPGTKALVVRQYPEVHQEIEELLKNLAVK
jgi:RNA polymerase sigma factor (sigma-70 family)